MKASIYAEMTLSHSVSPYYFNLFQFHSFPIIYQSSLADKILVYKKLGLIKTIKLWNFERWNKKRETQ